MTSDIDGIPPQVSHPWLRSWAIVLFAVKRRIQREHWLHSCGLRGWQKGKHVFFLSEDCWKNFVTQKLVEKVRTHRRRRLGLHPQEVAVEARLALRTPLQQRKPLSCQTHLRLEQTQVLPFGERPRPGAEGNGEGVLLMQRK